MGYQTYYSLGIDDPNVSGSIEIIDALRDGNEDARMALDECGGSEEPCKWYAHEEDMIRFSCKHPGILFELHGKGEDYDDKWIKYFRDGIVQVCRAKITFDECAI